MKHLKNDSFSKRINLLIISIGIIFFYFGVLKFFPNLSPAEQIGANTVCKLCFGLLSPKICLYSLASLEIGIGIALISRKYLRTVIVITITHLIFTFTPLIFSPELVFQDSLISPTLLGQYIYKNVIIIFALLVAYPVKNNVSISLQKAPIKEAYNKDTYFPKT